MRKLQLNDDVYSIPGSWNELTTEQLLYLIELVNKQRSAEEIKLKMLLYCMKANVRTYIPTDGETLYRIKVGKKKYDFSAAEIIIIADLFSYLFMVEKEAVSINPQLTKNPFPTLKVKRMVLTGLAEGLSDATYGQFVMLTTYFQQMQAQPEALNDFIAVMYKKADKTDCSANLIRKLPEHIKTGILWYYLGSIRFMTEKFPITFSGDGESAGNVFEGQMRIIDALANNDVTKKETVKNALLYDALYSLELAAERAEKVSAERHTKT